MALQLVPDVTMNIPENLMPQMEPAWVRTLASYLPACLAQYGWTAFAIVWIVLFTLFNKLVKEVMMLMKGLVRETCVTLAITLRTCVCGKRVVMRSVGTQSQCTYDTTLAQPRFKPHRNFEDDVWVE